MLFALFTLAGVPTSPVLMIAYFSGECFLFFALFCDSFVNFNKNRQQNGKCIVKKNTVVLCVGERVHSAQKER